MSKKKTVQKSASLQEKELYVAFLKRLKTCSDVMVGHGFFESIAGEHLIQLFKQRFPPLKLEFAPGIFDKDTQASWQERFRLRMSDLFVRAVGGAKLPVADFFRDGILLVNYAQFMAGKGSSDPIMKTICEIYRGGSPLYLRAAEKVIGFVNSICVVHSDMAKESLTFDLSSTAILNAQDVDNKIRLAFKKPTTVVVELGGNNRELTQLCWSDMFGRLEEVMASPAKLGFGDKYTEKVPVYLQQHASLRLLERLGMANGLTLYLLEGLIRDKDSNLRVEQKRLLPFRIMGKKLGYLVTDRLDDKLVIITFLFLTNDGTPEGKKLAELTLLEKLDKQFLGIDTLSGFRSLNIAEDQMLSQLFIEAGCGDLLDLADISPVLSDGLTMKDPEMLIRYLQDSPFMSRNRV